MHDTLSYMRDDPVHRKWHHRDLSFGLLYAFSERFVLPFSHDEVVHGKGSLIGKMPGDDWQRFANLRAMYAWMWAMPGAPLLFMGAEIAPFTEWNEAAGLPWWLLDHAAPPRRPRPAHRPQRRRRRVAGAVGARPRADRLPVARRRRRGALDLRLPALGARRRQRGGLRRQLHARCPGPGTASACRGRGSGRCCSTATPRRYDGSGYRGGVATATAIHEDRRGSASRRRP